MMPGGGGLAVIDRMRREPDLGSTRVIVISAFSGDDDRTAARDAGADAFVAKPFDPDELSARVEELLAGGS
jgi:DNA-binding response OmpR family regulator